jgi:protein-disulfide isomerase
MIGHGPVRVDAFIDFLCPFCRRFELAADGRISLIHRPFGTHDLFPERAVVYSVQSRNSATSAANSAWCWNRNPWAESG